VYVSCDVSIVTLSSTWFLSVWCVVVLGMSGGLAAGGRLCWILSRYREEVDLRSLSTAASLQADPRALPSVSPARPSESRLPLLLNGQNILGLGLSDPDLGILCLIIFIVPNKLYISTAPFVY